jgi:hypothetical protein
MKKLFLCFLLIISVQTFAQDKIYNLDKKTDSITYKKTNSIAIYKGKLFIFVTSKKGNQYKKYIQ